MNALVDVCGGRWGSKEMLSYSAIALTLTCSKHFGAFTKPLFPFFVQYFDEGSTKVAYHVAPDEAVACGAALEAALLEGHCMSERNPGGEWGGVVLGMWFPKLIKHRQASPNTTLMGCSDVPFLP